MPVQAETRGICPVIQRLELEGPYSFQPVSLVTIQLPFGPAPGKAGCFHALPRCGRFRAWDHVQPGHGGYAAAAYLRCSHSPDRPARLCQGISVACSWLPVQLATGEAGICPGCPLRQICAVALALGKQHALWLNLLQQTVPCLLA